MEKPEYQVIRFDDAIMAGNYTPSGKWCDTYCAPECILNRPNCDWECAQEECPDEWD